MRFFLILLLLYFLYWFLFSSRSNPRRSAPKTKKKYRATYSPFSKAGSQSQQIVIDEMKRCPTCSTFNPKTQALAWQGQYFCDERCKTKRTPKTSP